MVKARGGRGGWVVSDGIKKSFGSTDSHRDECFPLWDVRLYRILPSIESELLTVVQIHMPCSLYVHCFKLKAWSSPCAVAFDMHLKIDDEKFHSKALTLVDWDPMLCEIINSFVS
ncbi:hypothetical protein Ancab_027592 [Ancistrocladus abbreviatus]